MSAILLLLFGVLSQGTPAPIPPANVVLPELPPPPVPPPGVLTKLPADRLFVITADLSCIVLVSPPGYVKLTTEAGPLRIHGKFVDGGPAPETRLYKSKYIYILEAAAPGRVELLVVPSGALVEKDVIRRLLDVGGSGPGPDPPGPTPPVDPLIAVLQAAYDLDKETDKAALKRLLAEVYRQGEQVALDSKITTWGQWTQVMHVAAESLGLTGKLLNTRKAVQAEMLKLVPDKATPFDSVGRIQAGAIILRFSKVLEGVK